MWTNDGLARGRHLWLAVVFLLVPSAGQTAEPLDLTHIPGRAVAAVVVHPERLTRSPELELLPWEVMQVTAQREMGIDPLLIDTAIGIAAAPSGEGPPDWGLVLRFSQPQPLAGKWLEQTEPATAGQVAYRRALRPMEPSFCQIDPQTLLVGTEPMLLEMIAAREVDSPLLQTLRSTPMRNDVTAVLAVAPIRDLIKQLTAQAPPLPPPLQPLLEVPNQLESVMVAVNLSRERMSGIKLTATDEVAAQKLETTLLQGLGFVKQMLLGQALESMPGTGDDPEQQAMQRYMVRVANTIEGRLRPTRTGNQLVVTLSADYATSGVLVALLLPAVQAARDAARRTQGMNNLKQLGWAMHIFHDAHGAFPAAYNTDAEGKPLLSWRVHLLPYVEQQQLYEQFRLNEPWDSPHNRQLIAQMPDVFRAPGSLAPPGKTNYLGVRGQGMTFIAPTKAGTPPAGSSMRAFTDGTSNSVIMVEAGDDLAVEWTRPVDFEPDPTQPVKGLVGLRVGGFTAVFADGSVRFISSQIDPSMLMRGFTVADGQPVRFD
ncbi:MAG: DUF1559 domain-containing protein [Pirellulaceae bacterium]|nr:DUF1559 domain-containing protein [Pirellulaceae bacterium]